jgi:hypothetical protein
MSTTTLTDPATSLSLATTLERDGVVVLPEFIRGDQLRDMQTAFQARLRHLRWNDVDGYEQTERFRHMVQDVLTLAQGFVDAALHPVVKATLNDYLGESYVLCEAKGWLSLPTKKDFHGWHGDAWYDQTRVTAVPREVKLAIYLSDVRTGAFHYVKGSHGQHHPRGYRGAEMADVPADQVVVVTGKAGSAFLFDTSGIHRQGYPILEPRQAVFLNYHDPRLPLQQEDVDYYRYHPLLLNAAFLGNLTAEDQRILGFGEKTHYQHAFERRNPFRTFQSLSRSAFGLTLRQDAFWGRVGARLRRILGSR